MYCIVNLYVCLWYLGNCCYAYYILVTIGHETVMAKATFFGHSSSQGEGMSACVYCVCRLTLATVCEGRWLATPLLCACVRVYVGHHK